MCWRSLWRKKIHVKIYSSSWDLMGCGEDLEHGERWALSVRKADSGLKHTWQSWKLLLERAFGERWSCWGQDVTGRIQIIEQTRGEASGRSQGKWDRTIKVSGGKKQTKTNKKDCLIMWESFKEVVSLIFILQPCSKFYKWVIPEIFIYW